MSLLRSDAPKPERRAEDKIESVVHPPHYGGDTVYEVVKVIEAWELNFNRGNAAKYICRAGKKLGTSPIEDLEKARFYLQLEIDILRKGNRK